MEIEREYISIKELAQIIGCTRQTASKLIDKARNDVTCTRLGNKMLIKKKEIIAYIDTHRNISLQ